MIVASRHGKMNRGWDLGSNAVIGKRTDETNRSGSSARRYFGEVGVLGFPGICEAVETATDFDNLTGLS
jgi:hypothetical protein